AAQLPAFVAWLEKIASAENLVTLFERTWALVRATTDALLRLAGIDLGKMLDPKNAVAGWQGLWEAVMRGADAFFGIQRVLADLPGLAQMAFGDMGELAKRLGQDIELAISRAMLGAFQNIHHMVREVMTSMVNDLNQLIASWNKTPLGWANKIALLKTPEEAERARGPRPKNNPNFGSQDWIDQQRAALDLREKTRPKFVSLFGERLGQNFSGQRGDMTGQTRFDQMLRRGIGEARGLMGPQTPAAPSGGLTAPPGHQFGGVRTPATVTRMYGPGQFPSAPSMGMLVGATADMLEAAIKLAEARIENFPAQAGRINQMELRPLLMQLYQAQTREAGTEKDPAKRLGLLAGAEGTRGRIMGMQAGMPTPLAPGGDPFAPVRLPDGRVVSRVSLLAQQGGQGAGTAGNTVTAGPNGAVNINLTVFPTNREQILGTIEEALTRAGVR
ncbi:MAG: hypothetical protein Q7T33_09080, partial [Dehalococcoidia bacterium]|nr:hypothetical protein [Dehalococcoidia bacterium]